MLHNRFSLPQGFSQNLLVFFPLRSFSQNSSVTYKKLHPSNQPTNQINLKTVMLWVTEMTIPLPRQYYTRTSMHTFCINLPTAPLFYWSYNCTQSSTTKPCYVSRMLVEPCPTGNKQCHNRRQYSVMRPWSWSSSLLTSRNRKLVKFLPR